VAERGSGNTDLEYLSRLLRGTITSEPPKPVRYVPYIRVRNFLDQTAHQNVINLTLSKIDEFAPALVRRPSDERSVEGQLRRGKIYRDSKPFEDAIWSRMEETIKADSVLMKLGEDHLPLNELKFQVTCYGDGDFFGAHKDRSEAHNIFLRRRVSFVYYFRRQQDSFEGGDLLLYDNTETSDGSKAAYTRLAPEDNSIVFFPSGYLHEVTPTIVSSGLTEDGRFTINGWMLCD
ncbi:MAG: 2OG-Fe(II) oxygenase family protein, partial [Pseudomonadota bacterium]